MTGGAGDNMKLAVVTGASSGIGLALAHQFAKHGFDVVVAADNEAIFAAESELAEHGRHVFAVRVDLATSDGVETWHGTSKMRAPSTRSPSMQASVFPTPS